MRPKTQIELFQALHRQRRHLNNAARAFTLVELMIVVAIIGILSAVALPQYTKARNRAEAGARVGEAIGLAKECATSAASNLDEDVSGSAAVVVAAVNSCVGGGTVTASFTDGDGIQCLATTLAAGSSSAVITITDVGGLSCTGS